MPRTDPRIPRNMAQAILRCDADATKILQSFINTVESQKPPPMLYHYTNDAGLAGIIESGRLWFSDIFALNDPSELRLAVIKQFESQPEFIAEMIQGDGEPDVLDYRFGLVDEPEIHSGWLLTYYGRTTFVCVVFRSLEARAKLEAAK